MDFGSSYVYMYDEVGYESISAEEFSDGMQVSCSDSYSDSDDDQTVLTLNTETAGSTNTAAGDGSALQQTGGADRDETNTDRENLPGYPPTIPFLPRYRQRRRRRRMSRSVSRDRSPVYSRRRRRSRSVSRDRSPVYGRRHRRSSRSISVDRSPVYSRRRRRSRSVSRDRSPVYGRRRRRSSRSVSRDRSPVYSRRRRSSRSVSRDRSPVYSRRRRRSTSSISADSDSDDSPHYSPVSPSYSPVSPVERRHKRKAHWKLDNPSTGERLQNSRGGQKVRSGDTNIVSIKFNQLITPSNMHAGDPQYCSGCGAILSKISKLEMKGEEKVWSCEFCSVTTVVDVEDEEVPTEEDVTFMLEPALSTQASGPSGLDESLVVFCVDISGSMGDTTRVPGNIELRAAQKFKHMRRRRHATYITRLQCVQAAMDHQLEEMEKNFPNQRVALITFSGKVKIIGDGRTDPVCLADDIIGSKEALKSVATEIALPGTIKTSRKALEKKIFELEEQDTTALGPALLVACTLAARVWGSKVILCTDGLANEGMGDLGKYISKATREASRIFYDELATTASDDGVVVSVITIKGTDCKLVEIGKLADKTGGQVNIVDPLKLTQDFNTILANKIIATNVTATFILHKQLFFFYEESEESKVVKKIGNVTADTEITFEYGVRTNKDAKQNDKAEVDAQVTDEPMEINPESAINNDEDSTKDQAINHDLVQSDGRAINPIGEPRERNLESATTSNKDLSTDQTIKHNLVQSDKHPIGEPRERNSENATTNNQYVSTDQTVEQSLDESDKHPDQTDKPGTSSNMEVNGTKQDIEFEYTELPFQLQIVYTDTEGAKALRVLTRVKPVTKDRQKAEKMAKLDVLATHTAQTSAQMALDGQYTMSRQRALMNQRVAWRHTRGADNAEESKKEYRSKFGKIQSMENYLNNRQKTERRTRGRTYSCSASDSDSDGAHSDDSASDDSMMGETSAAHSISVDTAIPSIIGTSADSSKDRASANPPTDGDKNASKASTSEEKAKNKTCPSRVKKQRLEITGDDGAKLVYRGKVGKKFFEDDD